MTPFIRTGAVTVTALMISTFFSTSSGMAQTQAHVPDSDYIPADKPEAKVGEPPHLPATAFVMPDVPDSWNRATTYDSRALSARFSTAMVVDYTAFTQDSASVSQVGEQVDQWDLRTFRLMSVGSVKFKHPIHYFVSVEVKGQDHVLTNQSAIGFTDWYVATSLGPLGQLRYGKSKEPFAYELVGDSANLPFQERMLMPFFVTRGTGFRLDNTMAGKRMSWSVGWFNSWWIERQPFGSTANDIAGRLTGLPYLSKNGDTYLHLAVGLRYAGDSNGTMQFRDRPESATADYYVDTGKIQAEHAMNTSVEGLWNRGPLSLLSEYARARVDSPATGDPSFWGGYVTVSYVLTGEHRPYDPKVAYARRVLPQGRWGAWEVFARYSHIDLDDALVAGGTMNKGALGVTWWATRRWKIGFDYGLTDLDRFGAHGWTNGFHTRLQWTY
jgi:phosphate-selective porin OprO/OprP